MLLNVNGTDIFYEREQGENSPVLLLHGWGCNVNVMRRIFYFLAERGHDVVSIDLPGFGKSITPDPNFTVFSYAELVRSLINKLFSRPVTVLGHSFGGRIALILGNDPCVERLVLVSAAGMKPRRKLSYYLKVLRYKIAKRRNKLLADYGSDDYKALAPDMRKVFVSVVNTHLEKYAEKVAVPTFLIWGERDDQTPIYMAKRMRRLIKGSKLTVLSGCGHFCFADDFTAFALALEEALC